MAAKETQELLASLEAIIVAGEAAVADGKLDGADLFQIPAVIPSLIIGAIGINKIPGEMKDPTELANALTKATELLVRAGVLIAQIAAILKAKKAA